MALSSIEVKSLIKEQSLEEIQQIYGNSNDAKILYLGYLCSKGIIEPIQEFIEQLGEDSYEIINAPHIEFYFGTVLHIALYWNSGLNGLKLFNLLVSYGAKYYKDYYQQLPWKQTGIIWTNVIPDNYRALGRRDEAEFNDLYIVISDHVNN